MMSSSVILNNKMINLQKSSRPLFLSTLVFFDLETTGLPSANFKPEITELCMLATSRFCLESTSTLPRVENKLNLCFHPSRTISSIASKISGLNEDNLFHQKDFDAVAVDLIQLFLNRLDSPVCLIAHNGFRFDFPLLRAQILGIKGPQFQLKDCTGSPICCMDTLQMFKEFAEDLSGPDSSNDSGFISVDEQASSISAFSQSTPKKISSQSATSFHLSNVYSRVFGSCHKNAHHAEGDCRAMLQLVQHLGSPGIDWLQSHYIDFNVISPMYELSTSEGNVSLNLFPYQRKKKSDPNTSVNMATDKLTDLQLK